MNDRALVYMVIWMFALAVCVGVKWGATAFWMAFFAGSIFIQALNQICAAIWKGENE